MTFIVTGGAGFVGSHFIFYLLSAYPDDRVVCLDRLTYAGHLSTLSSVMGHPNFRFARVDICDRESVYQIFEEERPDVVVNFAAESHVDRSIKCPDVFLKTNVLGVETLMDACRQYGTARYHQISTDEVYGEIPPDQPDFRFAEEAPLRPGNPYSSSKAGADLLVLAYCRTYGLPATISRSSNNYGSYQLPEKLIPRMIVRALQNRPLPVYGRGENIRDWLYVEDHCRAIDLILRRGKFGEVYNIGGHNEMRNIDIVVRICRTLGRPESLIAHVADRPGHDMQYAVDTAKIEAELGWRPETAFTDGLEKTVRWYLDHRTWWEDIVRQNRGTF